MRGAHLQLAQRHKKLVAGRFRGRCVAEPEEATPGVVGQLAICFTTNGALPTESRITCELPDHGWRVLPTHASTPIATAPAPVRINAQLQLPQNCVIPSLRSLWHAATRTLEFTLLPSSSDSSSGAAATASAIPPDTPVVILVAGVQTPEAATPSTECVVTAFEKLVVRATAPISTRGGQIIDGPCRFTLAKIQPGALTGPKRWLPFSCVPSATSDVTLSVRVNGAVPRGGTLLIELPADGWDMAPHPRVLLRHAAAGYCNRVVPARWTKAQHALEVTLDAGAIPMKTSFTLTVVDVTNPAVETLRRTDSASAASTSASARITTLSPSGGGVIDGPSRLDVACICELRDCDLALVRASFDAFDVTQRGAIALETLRSVLEHARVRLSDELYTTLVVANLPDRLLASSIGASDADSVENTGSSDAVDSSVDAPSELDATHISRDEVQRLYARVYAPATRFGQDLRLACGRAQLACVQEWLARGCDANATDGAGWSAAHYAADYGHVDVLTLLIDETASLASATAAAATMTPLAMTLPSSSLQQPLNVNARDSCGWTPLLCAAANGHTRVVEVLLAAGADVHIASVDGRTALHWAAARGMDNTVRVLLSTGAAVTAADRCGWTPLHCATLHSSSGCATLLLESEASPTQTDQLSTLR